jgi:CRISPR-associated exonuclease Cas4
MVSVDPLTISGTWVWYFSICPRQLWFMAHAITPDEDDPNLEYGRFIHDHNYLREGPEVSVGASRMDRVVRRDGETVVMEIKKSSRTLDVSRLQLAHYLYQLECQGVKAVGELHFPEERRKERVVLSDSLRVQLDALYVEIVRCATRPSPPSLKRIGFCTKCAYRDYCWS